VRLSFLIVFFEHGKHLYGYPNPQPSNLSNTIDAFIQDANHNAADYDENMGRAIACEVLARRIVHNAPPRRLNPIMSTRFRHRERDGEETKLSSALELAIDQHCTIFLSSNEAQFGADPSFAFPE
jgi:hypothetical protein